jgi:hypothetical protein
LGGIVINQRQPQISLGRKMMMQAGFADADFICYVSIAEAYKIASLNQPLHTCQHLIAHVHGRSLDKLLSEIIH